MAETSYWKQCSSCKKEIPFSTTYQVCSVSTCNRKRTGMVFCTVGCWEIHLPMMRHREAWAVEERSPSKAQWERELEQERVASSSGSSGPSSSSSRSSSGGSAPALRRPSAMPARPVGTIGSRPASAVSDRPPPDKPPPRPTSSDSSAASVSSSDAAASAQLPASTAAAMASSAPGQNDGFLDVDESELPRDILIVVSKLKKYIRARSGFNTSDGVMAILSDHVRAICRQAIRNAARDERKTVLDRDVPRPPRT